MISAGINGDHGMTTETTDTQAKPHFLMCRPEHFGVIYSINPWMNPRGWAREEASLAASSHRQWARLHRTLLDLGADVDLVPPVAGLPDLVFTANAAVVLDRKVLLARFRHPERQAEEAHFEAAFRRLQAHGVLDSVTRMPDGITLEGAGDCVFDQTRGVFWMGHGPRTDQRARPIIADLFATDVVAMELADPRFYHMDTALCPLSGGELLYIPGAFTDAGRAAIAARVAPEQRIAVDEKDAVRLAANTVCVGNVLVMPACSPRLRAILAERGYRVEVRPLPAFLRSGGAAFCLTLRLDRRSAALGAEQEVAVA
jgi:N-dimethylarginine dimethylaminohydrolase